MISRPILTFALVASFSFGQKLKFKVANQKDTTVYLVKYFGQKLYYADTAEMKGGYVEFDELYYFINEAKSDINLIKNYS